MSLTIELEDADLAALEADARDHGLPVHDWAAVLLAGMNALRRREEAQQDAEDLADVRARLADTSEPNIPWDQIKAEMGLA